MADTSIEMSEGYQELYFIETFLRQSGDYKSLLAVDEVIVRDDLSDEQKSAEIERIIQESLNGKR